jgi:rhodanese-related sulfurtransferase
MSRIRNVVIGLSLFCSVAAHAAPEPTDPERQTPWKLYVDSKEAFAMKQAQGGKVLLVDIRDPIEIMFTGFAPTVDVVVPFMSPNLTKWNEKKSVYQVERDPAFADKIAKALSDRGLGKDTPILLMCRSGGERGAPSAKELWDKGYSSVYVVVDGFEGETIKDGPQKNWRLVNGWKNSGLPWGYTLDRAKLPVAGR